MKDLIDPFPNSRKVAVGRVSGGPLKNVWIAATQQAVIRLSLGGSQSEFQSQLRQMGLVPEGKREWVTGACRQVREYLLGRRKQFRVDFRIETHSSFAQKVLNALSRVPYGTVITYGELAEQVGCPRGARAIGRVMASNPLPLLVPCHRVVAARGLGGFGCGIQVKQDLLQLEGAWEGPGSRTEPQYE